jgi:hypothetical protein
MTHFRLARRRVMCHVPPRIRNEPRLAGVLPTGPGAATVASGKGPDVRDAIGLEQNAPEDDDRPDAQAGFCFPLVRKPPNRRLRIMSAIISPPAARPVAPVSDRRHPAPHAQHRPIITTGDRKERASATTLPLLRVRISADHPNHHLWNNHGTWYLHYTVHPTPFTKERVRCSLATPSLDVARERRDSFFAHLRAPATAPHQRAEAA